MPKNTLVIGPCLTGKSLYIKEVMSRSSDSGEIFEFDVFHFMKDRKDVVSYRKFIEDDQFKRVISALNGFSRIVVLVSPVEEILQRNQQIGSYFDGAHEKSEGRRSQANIGGIDFFKTYEFLFDLFEQQSIGYEVVYSSSKSPQKFIATDRVYVSKNLRGIGVDVPSADFVSDFARARNFTYQRVLLPHGHRTSEGKYKHVSPGRLGSLIPFLSNDLRDRSVLDIGSAMGEALFTAERHGASRLLGIEVDRERQSAAQDIASILGSKTEFVNADFNSADIREPFDYVLALNVLHHVRDFDYFLTKAARLTKISLFVEFPTFLERKYLALNDISADTAIRLNKLPLIGVSTLAANQTYVYAPEAIIKLVMDRAKGFEPPKPFKSPISGRVILKFSRSRKPG